MKRLVLAVLVVSIVGCATPTTWINYEMEAKGYTREQRGARLQADVAYCRQYALAAHRPANVPYVPPPETTMETVTVYGPNGSVANGYYTSTTNAGNGFLSGFAQGFSVGDDIATNIAQKREYESCLNKRGWYIYKE